MGCLLRARSVLQGQGNPLLEGRGVEGSKNQQLLTSLDTGDRDVNCEWASRWVDTKVCHYTFLDRLSLRHMRCDGKLGGERELLARDAELRLLQVPTG